MKKIAIIGARGQLGSLFSHLYMGRSNCATYGLSHTDIDITDRRSTRRALEEIRPHIIINCASYHDVDACEDDPDQAFEVNSFGASNLAVIADRLDAVMVHFSSDYVFGFSDYERSYPIREDEPMAPVNEYGRSKCDGEKFVKSLCEKHFIIRTSWLFGPAGANGTSNNFVRKMKDAFDFDPVVKVINDQTGSPSYAVDVAAKTIQVIESCPFGTYHIANSGMATWYELAQAIKTKLKSSTELIPITSADFYHKADRPHFSALDNYNLRMHNLDDMPTWQDALDRYMADHL